MYGRPRVRVAGRAGQVWSGRFPAVIPHHQGNPRVSGGGEIEAKKLGNSLRKWTQAENSQKDDAPGISGTGINLERENEDMTLPNVNPSSEIKTVETAATDKTQLDTNDPVSWLPITDPVRCFLVEKGPEQGKGSKNIYLTEGEDTERKFHVHWFTKKMSNGEMVPRPWLMYSKKREAIFCFPCILFGSSSTKQTRPALADAQRGFNDWRHLSPCIPERENSTLHRENCIKWKTLEQQMKNETTIDASLQKAIDQKTKKWRHILKVCTSIILFCAENNLPLRGSHEQLENQDLEFS
ncbi:hypothetical protein ILUMI_16733 [Ignelater luminosus]|uniref:TTF-type domain-containing protein n=1 Tax=Ignelater luminosus TaxID=2038154 RepID=A0A8K0G2K7_IGNLU|nr:hypothetical protein ILUMI_16733 [Ignelater luminosus]